MLKFCPQVHTKTSTIKDAHARMDTKNKSLRNEKVEPKTKEMKYLVIWDGQCQFKFPGSHKADIIISQKELNAINVFHFDTIFLLAELSWTGRLRSEFYGFKVAKHLRLEKRITCPIVFCSFMKDFSRTEFPESRILRRPGHFFLRLPEEPDFGKYNGIDEDMLEDINGNLFDNHQYIRDFIHDVQGGLINYTGDLRNLQAWLETRLEPLKTFIRGINPNSRFDELDKKIKKEIDDLAKDKGVHKINVISILNSEDFTKFLPINNEDDIPWTKKRWQVLYIDDDIKSCEKIKSMFKEREVICQIADSSETAFRMLKEDTQKNNLISVIISDHRLYKEGDIESDTWQEFQGLQILKHIVSIRA